MRSQGFADRQLETIDTLLAELAHQAAYHHGKATEAVQALRIAKWANDLLAWWHGCRTLAYHRAQAKQYRAMAGAWDREYESWAAEQDQLERDLSQSELFAGTEGETWEGWDEMGVVS